MPAVRLRRTRIWLLLALGSLGIGAPAEATTSVRLDFSSLLRASDVVVHASVLQSQAARDPRSPDIYSYSELNLRELLWGELPKGAPILVKALGGESGDEGLYVPGAPRLKAGDDLLLFLRSDPRDPGCYRVVGMSQGVFDVEPSKDGQLWAYPRAAGLHLTEAPGRAKGPGSQGQSAHEDAIRPMRLADLVEHLAQVARKAPAKGRDQRP